MIEGNVKGTRLRLREESRLVSVFAGHTCALQNPLKLDPEICIWECWSACGNDRVYAECQALKHFVVVES